MSIKIVEINLARALQPIWGLEGYDRIRVFARLNDLPLGWIDLPRTSAPCVAVERLRDTLVDVYGWDMVRGALTQDMRPAPIDDAALPPISAVVCTRDRPEQLASCLNALKEIDYPDYEIVVVDNAPAGHETRQLTAALPVRYVVEARPGLDWARNRGIAEARHDLVAFTDDDARPDSGWLRAIGRSFQRPDIMAVTGPALPAELETRAQILFELYYGGMSHGFHRNAIRRKSMRPRDILWASGFGVGANMAYRRRIFDLVGLFDPALDVGTPTGGAGDVEMFHRIVAAGHVILYEPAAYVWHTHRRDMAALRNLLFNNGRGFGSYLLTCGRRRSVPRHELIRFACWDWVAKWLLSRLLQPRGYPRRLILYELAGALASPHYYRAAQAGALRIAEQYKSKPGHGRIPTGLAG